MRYAYNLFSTIKIALKNKDVSNVRKLFGIRQCFITGLQYLAGNRIVKNIKKNAQ